MKLTLGVAGFFLSIAFVHGVDLPWVPLEFTLAMNEGNTVRDINGVPTDDLVRAYQGVVSMFIMKIGQKYYDKALEGRNEPQKIAGAITEKLINGTSKNPDEDLETVNKIALEAIELIPFNKSMGLEVLETPRPLGPVVLDSSPRTTKQLLTDYPKFMHKDIGNVRIVMDQLFMAGWNRARHFYELEVKSMRKHYSRLFLQSLTDRFDEIGRNSEVVRNQVSLDTWNEFLRVNDTLRTTFEWVKSFRG